ncbi:hypothetical protein PSDVSF_28120 [Pseudodesulfovibrio sediminis]|uniref:Uncharacterized protein n=1 Tax=Pseudodesulfovibrio sediminis TaxID=2810563 RepID=A0ABM7P808_9BACT|nr:hypothetical protein PSDVSF_28120 [Pseudodesulfovibrio sediminis]
MWNDKKAGLAPQTGQRRLGELPTSQEHSQYCGPVQDHAFIDRAFKYNAPALTCRGVSSVH